MSAGKKEEVPDCWIEVPTEPSVPKGWKKKVYRMNGRLNPKWVQYYDPQGNRYNSLQSVETYSKNFLQNDAGVVKESGKTISVKSDLNPKSVKSAKKIVSSCDICNIEMNSVEELQVHIKEKHSSDDDDDDESGKYFSDDDVSKVEDTSPDDPNLRCVECNTQYKKPNQYENHMKMRHGELVANTSNKEEIATSNKASESWEEFDEDMVDYEEEEELEDEFLEDMASKTMEQFQEEPPNKIYPKLSNTNQTGKSGNWYASVAQILQRFRLQDYQIPSKISNKNEFKDEAKFVEYVTPLLRSVNVRAKTSTVYILAKAKWFELMQGQGVTPLNGSLTNLRKPRMIVVNTL